MFINKLNQIKRKAINNLKRINVANKSTHLFELTMEDLTSLSAVFMSWIMPTLILECPCGAKI